MSIRKWVSFHAGRKYLIEEAPDIGFYFYVFEGPADVADYLQDTLEAAKEQALEDYSVPLESWQEQRG